MVSQLQTTTSRIRPRSTSPLPPSPTKKARLEELVISDSEAASKFATGLLEQSNALRLHDEYAASEPYKHAVVDALFDDELLTKAKDEILENIRFTEKETDIYKVHQTGDLASLSYLTPEQLKLFPSLTVLRDALYGPEFRQFVRTVTGCGPLSGSKQDMSINSYKERCHLLNHDDVIGTRRVSYILYLPLPKDQPWKPEYGGSLELYPTSKNVEGVLEPLAAPSKVIPPSWNQFIFFEVQPGLSFHSVEEVVVESGQEGRQRLSISGWFHKPQEGEEGYDPLDVSENKSSLEQLSTSSTPLTPYLDPTIARDQKSSLSDDETAFLANYLNPVYLAPPNLKILAPRFANESSIELHSFLRESLASSIEASLLQQDTDAGYIGGDRGHLVPSHSSGLEEWTVKGPPHKLRYCVLPPDSTHPLKTLETDLFPSSAFRSWLHLLSSTLPIKYDVEARRFRPGLDYTLAQSEQDSARLDVVLGLTPVDATDGWTDGKWGGWECYMAPHEGEEDPAVYRSGRSTKPKDDADSDEGDGDDEALLVAQPGWNRLLVVLRDAGVLHFVKYVSAEAQGSRFDVCGQWEVEDTADSDQMES